MQQKEMTIRAMTRPEIDIAVDWAAAEGWNPGLYDADCFHAADPDAFLIGLLGDEPVATISAVKYGDTYGFIGFFMVKETYRGRGYGIRIGEAALARLKGRNIGIDGVVAQQDNYRNAGFTVAYRHIRYQGKGGGDFPKGAPIVALSMVPFAEICAYDRPFFPEDRSRFLRCWIDQPRGAALGILRNHGLEGYGVVRLCRSGYKIGPLFADSPEDAERLFLALRSRVPDGAPIYLDAPEANDAAVDLAQRHRMNTVFETARMYLGQCPETPLARLFGVTSFELG